MKEYYIEESGYYKIIKTIEAESKSEAEDKFNDWAIDNLPEEIDLEYDDREIY